MTAGFLLDTNIVSEAIRPHPAPAVTTWLGGQRDDKLHIFVLTLAEIRRGILELAAGRRRRALEAWFSGPEGPRALFAGRVLSFDARSALAWARIMSEGTEAGRPRSAMDMIIAGTASSFGLTVATANERHFRGIGVPWFNPLTGTGQAESPLSEQD